MTSVGLIGTGNAGSALASALIDVSVDVLLWNRSAAKATRLARKTGARTTRRLSDLAACDLILICVSDDAIEQTAQRLARDLSSTGNGPTVLHCAGSQSSAPLAALGSIGCATGVFHPAVSLTGTLSAPRLQGGLVTLSGTTAAKRAGRALANQLGMRALAIDDERRPLMHLGAVMAAGDLIELLGGAQDLLAEAGMRASDARELISHLAGGALEAFGTKGAVRAATGPVPRGDSGTLRRHADALAEAGATRREVIQAHEHLARAAMDRLRASGRLTDSEWRRLRRALRGPQSG